MPGKLLIGVGGDGVASQEEAPYTFNRIPYVDLFLSPQTLHRLSQNN